MSTLKALPQHLPARLDLIGSVVALTGGVLLVSMDVYVALAVLGALSLTVLIMVNPLAGLTALLVLAPARTLIATESALKLPFDIGQILFAGLLFAWALRRIANRQSFFGVRWSPVLTALLPFVVFTGATGFFALSLSEWLTEWLKWVMMLVLIPLILHERLRWRWIAFVLVLAGTSEAFIGIYTFFGGSGADHLRINDRLFRAFGTFGQPNPFGGFMGLVAPISLGLSTGYFLSWWSARRQKQDSFSLFLSMFYIGAFFVLMIALFASYSRGAWLGFLLSIGVVVVAFPRRLWQSVALVFVLAGAGFTAWQTDIIPTGIVSRIENAAQEIFVISDVRGVDITTENYAIIERLAHWQAALNMARSNPYLGVGFGNYDAAYADYRLLNWHLSLDHAHNYYLNVLAEAGMIGLATYLALFYCLLRLSWQVRFHPDPIARGLGIGLLGTWVYLLVHSLTDNLYVNNIFIHLGVMLGLLAILHQHLSGHTRQR